MSRPAYFALTLSFALTLTAAPVRLQLDTSEAEQVLAILQKQDVTEADWQRLFETEPYVRLEKREAAMNRAFTDEEFRAFVLSSDIAKQREALRRTLESWKKADMTAMGERVLAYLPKDAMIAAKVFPMIKPRTNSFVFDVNTDPAIFLYLDPARTQAQFENTVAHELHHIGFSSLGKQLEQRFAGVSKRQDLTLDRMFAFGEGFAMLAAAGSADRHPHEASPASDRQRWDRDVANFNADAEKLEAFFLDILEGRLTDEKQIGETAFSFYGEQGPWYTVGWKMAVTIEKRFGRDVLIECMQDPRKLLTSFNDAAKGTELRRWSPKVIALLR